jgi:curved DNA-binding protein
LAGTEQTMKYHDYYADLGLKRDATQDEVKRAYRKLARKYHPDLSNEPDAEANFKEIGEAYEVLKDPEKRAAYDQLGEDVRAGQEFRPPPNWDTGFEHRGGYSKEEGAAFSDFFETLFGRDRAYRPGASEEYNIRGENHHAKILIDVKDAYKGDTRTISLSMPVLDEGGHVVLRERKLNLKIPKGVGKGQHIRLAGQGGPGIGDAPAGDLFLEIDFSPHSLYRVEGKDVFLELPVAPWEAALGAKFNVPSPKGTLSLTVPAGSKQGQRLRLKGQGIPGKTPGDFYCILRLTLPSADNDEAREVYRYMQEKLRFNPRAGLGV